MARPQSEDQNAQDAQQRAYQGPLRERPPGPQSFAGFGRSGGPGLPGGAARLAHYWPMFAVVGACNVLAGVLALALPGVTVLALALVLGLVLVAAGVLAAGIGVTLLRRRLPGGWALILGVLSVLAGVLVLIHPGHGVRLIVLACALWFLVTGIGNLAMSGRGGAGSNPWAILVGALSIVAGILLLFDLNAGIVTVSVLVGLGFLLRGAAEFALALRLRALGRASR